jgi:CBS domain-containing protein
MTISPLIDRKYTSVDILDEVYEVSEWLKERRYLVPIDQNLNAVGIVTIDDIHRHPYGIVKDCDISKPSVKPDDTLFYVLEVMQENDLHYLPVFEGNKFIGVISITRIARRLAFRFTFIKKYISEANKSSTRKVRIQH